MPFFITNGEVAWQIPAYLGKSYQSGRYLTPPGWELKTSLPDRWRQGPTGEFRNMEALKVGK